MATIITLPARRQGRPAQADRESGATILFFTGVRYERETEPSVEIAPEPPTGEDADATTCAAL